MRGKYLNLGCGNDYRPGWDNVDKNESVPADMHFDLEEPWPLLSDDYDHVDLKHVIEHVFDLDHCMSELYRILKPGGTVEIIAPYYSHAWAWGDPDHKRAISENTFIFYSKKVRESQPPGSPMTPPSVDVDFDIEKITRSVDREAVEAIMGQNATDFDTDFCIKHYINIVEEITIRLRAVKGEKDAVATTED